MSKPELQDIAIHALQPGRYQPRSAFDETQLQELADSIRAAGLLQPIIVRPVTSNSYEIVAGERRWRAAQLGGLKTVTCLVNQYTDEQAAEVATIENINRVDLNPLEEARAYQRLIDEFGYLHEEVAAAIGKSRAKISNCLRLLKLSPQVQQLIAQGELSEGHGKALAGLSVPMQRQFVAKVQRYHWSVRKLEQAIKASSEQTATVEKDVNILALEQGLAQLIGCQTQIDFQQGKGQLTIDFHNLDVLQGLLKRLGYMD